MRASSKVAFTSALALVLVLAYPPGAQAVGELTSGGCVDDNDTGADSCAVAVNALDQPESVAVSPDGTSVYVGSNDDEAVVRFSRSSTGALTPAGCVDDNDTGPDVCAQSANGLQAVFDVDVSPDGKSVYAVGFSDNALVRFNRDANGALTPAGCIENDSSAPDGCAVSTPGLNGPLAVTVSPDGTSVYVASVSNSIVRFDRSSTGALTPAGCITDNDTLFDACAQAVNGLEDPVSLAVSPDGKSLYVASEADDAVVRFNRSTTGALTPAGCIDDNDTGPDVCAVSANALDEASSVSVSPDGKSVYVTSDADEAIARFNRSTTGALTPAGCIEQFGPDTCAQSGVGGLDFVNASVVSSDGASVYTVSPERHTVVIFDRSSSGALTPVDCVGDNDQVAEPCGLYVNGLQFSNAIAVSADGKSVYVTAGGDDALVRFNRAT